MRADITSTVAVSYRAEYRTDWTDIDFLFSTDSDRIMICPTVLQYTTATSNVINLINLAVDVININTNTNMLSSKYYLLILLSFTFSLSWAHSRR